MYLFIISACSTLTRAPALAYIIVLVLRDRGEVAQALNCDWLRVRVNSAEASNG
jgi:alpha-D-ribose 1-methylphosphonate 5-triphosphate diphosphatase PhnM